MGVAFANDVGKGVMEVEIEGWATAAGNLGSLANPEGVTLMITRSWLYSRVISALAATLNVGIGTDAQDVNDILSAVDLNALAAGSAISGFAQIVAAETAMTTPALWTAAKFLSFTTAAQVSTAFRGTLFLEYIRVTE